MIRTALTRRITIARNPSKCTNFAAPPTTRTCLPMISPHMIKDLVFIMTVMRLAFLHLEVLRLILIVIVLLPTSSTSVTTHPLLWTTKLLPVTDLHHASALIIKITTAASDRITMPTTIEARREAAIVVALAQEWLQIESSSKAIALLHLS